MSQVQEYFVKIEGIQKNELYQRSEITVAGSALSAKERTTLMTWERITSINQITL